MYISKNKTEHTKLYVYTFLNGVNYFSITLNFCSLIFCFSSLESSVESGDAMAEIWKKRTDFLVWFYRSIRSVSMTRIETVLEPYKLVTLQDIY